MTALFGNLTTDGIEESQDRLGGFRVYETDTYTGKIKAVYAGKSATSQARSLTLILALNQGGEYRETFWVTNRNNQNFYEREGKKYPLPGFTIMDDICLVTTNMGLAQQVSEEKVMNVYDPEQKKEMPKSVQMLVNLIDKEVTLGILKETRNKQAQNDAGVYVDTDETREENTTDKVFHYPSNLTVVEARRQVQNPAFYGAWVEQNRGKTRDRTKPTNGQSGQSGRPGAGGPPKADNNGAKTSSLFGS